MCGIAGYIDIQPGNQAGQHELLKRMTSVIDHRGPDEEGAWLSDDNRVALGHRRLSILELSPLGSQPMESACGRYTIVYNGEVYNYKELANELAALGHDIKGGSDTAVMLAAIKQWGVEQAVTRFHGMFAFACFDKQQQVLHLVRDRMGEKPLYVGCYENKLLFASELKPVKQAFNTKPELNRQAIEQYLRHGYIPGPYTVYSGFFKLPSASLLSISVSGVKAFLQSPQLLVEKSKKYWQLTDCDKNVVNLGQAQDEFEQTLVQVVKREMRSDVPLGAFLSGGVDSSTIVALMQQHVSQPVNTFSIGFEQEEFNEAPFAKAVAEHLGTKHHERIVSASDVQALIPELATIYDEPFADSSQLPTILVSQTASEHVTVSLSGDGGDELFGGYERYQWAQKIWSYFSWMPKPVRTIIASLLQLLTIMNRSGAPMSLRNTLSKFQRLAAMLSSEDRQYFYRVLLSAEVQPQRFVKDAGGDLDYVLNQPALANQEFLHQMMYLDMHSYLPDDILTKVDRAAMSVSLETRVPLLDHEVVEKAWQLRHICNDNDLGSKAVLRRILYQYVPRELIERPKRGFAVPLSDWLRGPLKDWADSLLDKQRLQEEAVFDAHEVSKIWNDFQAGKAGAQHFIWSLLMFQLWYETWR